MSSEAIRSNQALPLAGIHGHDGGMRWAPPTTLRGWARLVFLGLWGVFGGAFGIPWLTALGAEQGLFDSPTARVGAVMNWTIALAAQPWFPWVAGALLFGSAGFAAGVWLDQWVRRRGNDGEASALATALVAAWFDPLEARQKFIENRLRREMEESLAEWRRRKFLADQAKLEWDGNANALADDKYRDRFQEFSTDAYHQRERYEELVMEANSEIKEKLRDGELVAKGFEVVGGVAEKEVVIDVPLWRFLSLDFENSTAGGHHRKYVAVQIGKPIRLVAG